MAETARRIVDATVGLHAEQGSLATSHAQIARRAGVAVPTVYKHFPTRTALLAQCMGRVERAAPSLDEAALLAAPPEERIQRLVDAVYRRHAYFAPWQRWSAGDARQSPELAAALDSGSRQLERLALTVLAPLLDAAPSRELKAVLLLLLGFDGWQHLSASLGSRHRAIVRVAADALRRLLPSGEPQP